MFQASNFLIRMRDKDSDDIVKNKMELLNKAGICENSPQSHKILLDEPEQWKAVVHNVLYVTLHWLIT